MKRARRAAELRLEAEESAALPSEDVEMEDVSRADPVGDELRRQAIQNAWARKKKDLKDRGIRLPADESEDVEMLSATKRKRGENGGGETKRKRKGGGGSRTRRRLWIY